MKRRNRNPLEMNSVDSRHLENRDNNRSYAPLVIDVGEEKIEARANKARKMHASIAQRTAALATPPKSDLDSSATPLNICPVNQITKWPGFYDSRDHAIRYMFLLFGSPREEEWEETNIVSLIMKHLVIPHNSYRSVLRVLKLVVEEKENEGKTFDPHGKKKRETGKKAAIIDGDSCAKFVYECVERGMNDTMTTFIVNQNRASNGEDILSRKAIYNFIKRSKVIVTSVRESTKQGSSDASSDWAKGRYIINWHYE